MPIAPLSKGSSSAIERARGKLSGHAGGALLLMAVPVVIIGRGYRGGRMAERLSPVPLNGDAIEIRYDAKGPVPLSDLAASLAALDAMFVKTARTEGRLSVSQMRSGSIITTLQPFLPILGQAVQAIDAALTVSDFTRRIRSAIEAFSGDKASVVAEDGDVAAELAEVLRPLTGRSGAELGIAHVQYRSKSKGRTVEVEAVYGAAQIDRAAINAEKHIAAPLITVDLENTEPPAPSLLRKVKLTFHQANSGPAKLKGATGDKGIIEAESTQPLPVYFPKGIDDLKAKMVGGAKNPLKSSYIVDAIVTRIDGAPRYYNIIEVHGPARAPRSKALPLLASSGGPTAGKRKKPSAA